MYFSISKYFAKSNKAFVKSSFIDNDNKDENAEVATDINLSYYSFEFVLLFIKTIFIKVI